MKRTHFFHVPPPRVPTRCLLDPTITVKTNDRALKSVRPIFARMPSRLILIFLAHCLRDSTSSGSSTSQQILQLTAQARRHSSHVPRAIANTCECGLPKLRDVQFCSYVEGILLCLAHPRNIVFTFTLLATQNCFQSGFFLDGHELLNHRGVCPTQQPAPHKRHDATDVHKDLSMRSSSMRPQRATWSG